MLSSMLSSFVLLALSSSLLSFAASGPQVILFRDVLDVCLTAESDADGAPVVIESCGENTSATQQWTVSGSSITIFGDKCLDNTNANEANGNKLQIFTCFAGNTNQEWDISGNTIKLHNTNFCLDDTNGVFNDGNPVQIWSCTDGPNQQWTFAPVRNIPPPSSGSSISPGKDSSLCLTALSNEDNAGVEVAACNPAESGQSWNVVNGNVQIFGNKCLDVPNGNKANGQLTQIFTCFQGNTNQLFTVTGDNRIAWTNMGECLDLTNGDATAGTRIQMYKCTDGDTNQVWNIKSLGSK